MDLNLDNWLHGVDIKPHGGGQWGTTPTPTAAAFNPPENAIESLTNPRSSTLLAASSATSAHASMPTMVQLQQPGIAGYHHGAEHQHLGGAVPPALPALAGVGAPTTGPSSE